MILANLAALSVVPKFGRYSVGIDIIGIVLSPALVIIKGKGIANTLLILDRGQIAVGVIGDGSRLAAGLGKNLILL